MARKSQLSLKRKSCTILIIFEIICLKSINSLANFLLAGDKFMPELHLHQSGLTCSPYGPSTKHCRRIENFAETSNLKYLFRNESDKACFVHDTAYFDSIDLVKRTIPDRILKDKAYEIARNCKHDGYQRALASMIYRFFDNKTESGVSVNEQLAKELYKPLTKRRKVCVRFKSNIWAADLIEMRSLSSKNNNVKYLYVIDVFTKCSWVKLLKDKKVKKFLMIL